MPSVRGFVQCSNDRLVGTFEVDGSPRYLYSDVKTLHQPFESGEATLTYDNITQLDGHCRWTGTVGKANILMDVVSGGVSIAAPLAAKQPSSHFILGEGAWDTVERISPPQKNISNVPVNPSPPHDAIRDPALKAARAKKLLESKNPIIIIFGQTGSGKSSFINLIASEKQMVGNGLHSCTHEISVVETIIGGKPVVIIDTPGIDNIRTGVKEADVLKDIADQLAHTGVNRIWVTGVLLLQRISENRFSQTATRISNVLKSLYGDYKMENLLLCTTMWDQMKQEDGDARLKKLCENPAWKELVSKGASSDSISCVRSNAVSNAERIVGHLMENSQRMELVIEDELINKVRRMEETSAVQNFNDLLRHGISRCLKFFKR